MKKLLVPTDFSDCANHAADLALRIAKRIEAEVHFYTRIAIHPFWNELTEEEKQDFPESFAELYDMKARFRELTGRYTSLGVPMFTHYSAGSMLSNVQKFIDEAHMDMVVMGSHGSDGLEAFMFGSNAQKLVRHAHCPVMVVKGPVSEVTFSQVIFASDFQKEALEPFRRLLSLVQHFSSHLHLLHIRSYPRKRVAEADARQNMEYFQSLAGALPCTLHQYEDSSVEKGITHFALELKADLVSLAHYGRSPLQRLFSGSVTEALVNHLPIPVLSLNPKTLKEGWETESSLPGEQARLDEELRPDWQM